MKRCESIKNLRIKHLVQSVRVLDALRSYSCIRRTILGDHFSIKFINIPFLNRRWCFTKSCRFDDPSRDRRFRCFRATFDVVGCLGAWVAFHAHFLRCWHSIERVQKVIGNSCCVRVTGKPVDFLRWAIWLLWLKSLFDFSGVLVLLGAILVFYPLLDT